MAALPTSPVAAEPSTSSRRLVPWFVLGLALIASAGFLARRSMRRVSVLGFAYEHRESLVVGGLTTAAAVGIGLAIAILGS